MRLTPEHPPNLADLDGLPRIDQTR
jgi:hypothetical protein